jgi:hypothetical protein
LITTTSNVTHTLTVDEVADLDSARAHARRLRVEENRRDAERRQQQEAAERAEYAEFDARLAAVRALAERKHLAAAVAPLRPVIEALIAAIEDPSKVADVRQQLTDLREVEQLKVG